MRKRDDRPIGPSMRLPHTKVLITDEVAAQLDARRLAMGLSVVELARLCGYSENTTLRVMHGEKNVRWNTLRDHAATLGYSLRLWPNDEAA